ncbi:ubiquitin-protein ligase, putative [Ricinus communis]|uniref:Ubiquitin-protein ligase, putative n=1 Tax=Ricinus communis TaxID=3988 RepID=B9RXE5_RICCO|nr:ubiquitin-protein ligase, putative [Ricinus communis]
MASDVALQESTGEFKTILGLLRDQMEEDGRRSRTAATRMTIKQRLGLRAFGCCGASWGSSFRSTAISVADDIQPPQHQHREQQNGGQSPSQIRVVIDPGCLPHSPIRPRSMNLAAALAAERQYRESTGETAPGTPLRVSLMRLLEEAAEESGRSGGGGNDTVCCVCMVRKKGAAFIPCGHTYCRVCSREVWLNRGSCPLCNRSILEILDLF